MSLVIFIGIRIHRRNGCHKKGEQGDIPCSFFMNKRLYPFEREFLNIKNRNDNKEYW